MSEAEASKPNPTLGFLLWGGVILAVAGLIGTFVSKEQAESAASGTNLSNQFATALGDPSGAVSPDYTFMWVWIVVGAVGLILLIAGIVVRAAKS